MRLIPALFISMLILPLSTQAFVLTGVGGANFGAPTQNLNGVAINWTGKPGLTFGGLIAFNLVGSLDFETGVIHATQKTEQAITPILNESMNWLEIPLLLRFQLDESLAFGLGGYVAFAQGDVTQSQGVQTQRSYSSLGLKSNDSGVMVNLRARFAFAPPVYLVIDGRYLHGITNLATTGGSDIYNTRSIQALAGISYDFGMSSNKSGSSKNTAPNRNRLNEL